MVLKSFSLEYLAQSGGEVLQRRWSLEVAEMQKSLREVDFISGSCVHGVRVFWEAKCLCL